MEKLKYYDEAANNFYGKLDVKGFPMSSLDIYSQYFSKLCSNLQDVKQLYHLAEKEKWDGSLPIRYQILDKEYVVVVTDAHLNIVYATQNMYGMNGYRPEEILGKTPRMFQGEQTCAETKKKVAHAIRQKEPFKAILVNYRKDGSTYKCSIEGSPVFDKTGKVVNFIAFEKEVA